MGCLLGIGSILMGFEKSLSSSFGSLTTCDTMSTSTFDVSHNDLGIGGVFFFASIAFVELDLSFASASTKA
jgi:hypothetical protein